MLTVLSLFAGIGGFDLGLERTAGFKTVAFCEIDPFCRRVLAKHWPGVPCYDDVRSLNAERLRTDGIEPDLICGGFPCQDISLAGAGAGIDGARSGLWREYARLIGEIRPRYVIVENVAALLVRGIERVLGDLAALGFDAEWHVISAADVGAPHLRERLWVVAHADHAQWRQDASPRGRVAGQFGLSQGQESSGGLGAGRSDVADANRTGLEVFVDGDAGQLTPSLGAHEWAAEPDVGRVAHGIPARVDRLRGLGNAVVPQVVTAIGRAILAAEAQRKQEAA